MNRHTSFAVAHGTIDEAAGVITGCSVITEGIAAGHGFEIDGKTLASVKACADTYPGGLKCKLNHGPDAASVVGTLKNFRIDGKQLRADLHLLKTSQHRAYVLELAKTLPESFGLSIVFSGTPEEEGEKKLARCSEIYSADLVDSPAANPSGLFSRGITGLERAIAANRLSRPQPFLARRELSVEQKAEAAKLTGLARAVYVHKIESQPHE